MEPVGVLGRVDRSDRRFPVEVARERKLHEDPVDGRVVVEHADQVFEIMLGDRGRKVMMGGHHSDLLGVAPLAANVDLGGGVVANENRGQAR